MNHSCASATVLLPVQEGILASHPQAAHLALKPHVHLRVHSLPYALDPAPHQLNPTISKVRLLHILSNLIAKRQQWVWRSLKQELAHPAAHNICCLCCCHVDAGQIHAPQGGTVSLWSSVWV